MLDGVPRLPGLLSAVLVSQTLLFSMSAAILVGRPSGGPSVLCRSQLEQGSGFLGGSPTLIRSQQRPHTRSVGRLAADVGLDHLVPPDPRSPSFLSLFPPTVFEGREGTARTSGVHSPLPLLKGRQPAWIPWNSSAWESCLCSPLLLCSVMYLHQRGLAGIYCVLRCAIRCSRSGNAGSRSWAPGPLTTRLWARLCVSSLSLWHKMLSSLFFFFIPTLGYSWSCSQFFVFIKKNASAAWGHACPAISRGWPMTAPPLPGWGGGACVHSVTPAPPPPASPPHRVAVLLVPTD